MLRPVAGTSTMTNSAFQIQTVLAPWTITDFEILLNSQNTSWRRTPASSTTTSEPSTTTQSTSRRRSTSSSTGTRLRAAGHRRTCRSTPTFGSTAAPRGPTGRLSRRDLLERHAEPVRQGSDGSITVNNVPANAEVWVTAHLDLRCKSQPYTCLQQSPRSAERPATYHFSSRAAVKVAGVEVSESITSTSLLGRGKKVTMVYGTVTAPAATSSRTPGSGSSRARTTRLTKTNDSASTSSSTTSSAPATASPPAQAPGPPPRCQCSSLQRDGVLNRDRPWQRRPLSHRGRPTWARGRCHTRAARSTRRSTWRRAPPTTRTSSSTDHRQHSHSERAPEPGWGARLR